MALISLFYPQTLYKKMTFLFEIASDFSARFLNRLGKRVLICAQIICQAKVVLDFISVDCTFVILIK